MRIRLAPAGASLIFALCATVQAGAADGFDVQRMQPSERGSTWFVLESLDLRGRGRPAVGVVMDYQREPLVIRSEGGTVRAAIIDYVLTSHVGAGVTLADRVRIAANVPVVLSTSGEGGTLRGVTYAPPSSATTLGDARAAVDARLFGAHDEPLTMAVGARLFVPTGAPSSYTGDGTVRFSPHVLAAGVASLFTYAAKLGVMLRDPDTSFTVGSELVYAASAGIRFAHGRATVGPEIFGSTNLATDAFKTRTSPLEALLGGHYALPIGVRFGAGIGAGVVSGYGAPQVRALASVEWTPEIAAESRHAPPSPPPRPAVDTDGDGITDDRDACMDVPGHETTDPRTNGCVDRDGDGIMDPLDHCPFEAGPKSDDANKNGCPERDADKPTGDRDGDGIPNDKDACPDLAGKPDPSRFRNGCPVAFVEAGQVRIRRQVKFKENSAQLDPGQDTEEILAAVAEVLKAHPEIERLRVEGHTDNRGDPKKNLKLSKDRAAAVVAWLVEHGVDKSRLTSAGFGMDRPIDANDTEEGRLNNRRVELHIEKSGEGPEK